MTEVNQSVEYADDAWVDELDPSLFTDFEIAPAIENQPYAKLFIWGYPDAGKSVFAARSLRPLILDCEQGTRSLINHPEIRRMPIVKIKSWSQIERILMGFHEGDPRLAPFKTLVIDSGPELQNRLLMERTQAKRTFVPIGGDYREVQERMKVLVSYIRDLPVNFIMTSTPVEATVDSPTGQRVYLRPDLMPKLWNSIFRLMDLVAFMRFDPQYGRLLQTVGTDMIIARSRIGGLDPVMINPTFQQILDAKTQELLASGHEAPLENAPGPEPLVPPGMSIFSQTEEEGEATVVAAQNGQLYPQEVATI